MLFPEMDTQPIRSQYEMQWWSQNKEYLKAWQKGNTGYPLVDAAMRQLWAIGWMNNYLRHVVASFLISYLRISWVEGYKWFQDTLLDADVAINGSFLIRIIVKNNIVLNKYTQPFFFFFTSFLSTYFLLM